MEPQFYILFPLHQITNYETHVLLAVADRTRFSVTTHTQCDMNLGLHESGSPSVSQKMLQGYEQVAWHICWTQSC